MIRAMLFTVSKTWEQPKCPSTDEKIKTMWYTYTMEYYSAIERNGTGSLAVMWTDLKSVIQSEVKSEREKQILCANAYMWDLEKGYGTYLKGRTREAEKRHTDTEGKRRVGRIGG